MSSGSVVRKDNYRLLDVICLLYVYVIGSCLLKAAGDNIFSPFCWNLAMKVVKYDVKDSAVALLAKIQHMWLVT